MKLPWDQKRWNFPRPQDPIQNGFFASLQNQMNNTFCYKQDSTATEKPFHYAIKNGIRYDKVPDPRLRGSNGSVKRFQNEKGEQLIIKKARKSYFTGVLQEEGENIEQICNVPCNFFWFPANSEGRGKDTKAYLTMPYCDGITLDQHITQMANNPEVNFPLFIRTICQIMYLLGVIVCHVHDRGYSYSDIKGDNIIFYFDEQAAKHFVYLIDYGSTKKFTGPFGKGISKHRNWPRKTKNNFNPQEFFKVKDGPLTYKITSKHDVYSLGTMFLRAIAAYREERPYHSTPLQDMIAKAYEKINSYNTHAQTNQLEPFGEFCNQITTRCSIDDPNQRMEAEEFTSRLYTLLGTQFVTCTYPSAMKWEPMGISATFSPTPAPAPNSSSFAQS